MEDKINNAENPVLAEAVEAAEAEAKSAEGIASETDAAESIASETDAAETAASETDAADDNGSDDNDNDSSPDTSSPRFLARLVITLTVICAAVAMLLAAVNAVTRTKIADNSAREKNEAILEIFTSGTSSELYKTLDDGSEIYLVLHGDGVIGYCAFVSESGFGGSIDMMVGVDSAYDTVGVKIVSMSETPGVGTKTNTASFLDRFVGKHHASPTESVDGISGATISSNAVKAGVLAAHEIAPELAELCAERGCELISPQRLAEILASESTTDAVPDTTAADGATGDSVATDSPVTGDEPSEDDEPVSPDTSTESDEPVETTDDAFVSNPGMRDYLYNVEVSNGSDRFVIEIPKDDETATFVKATTPAETPAPVTTPAPVVPTPAVSDKVTTAAPETTIPDEDDETIPSWLDTEPEETLPSWLDTEPEETLPSWLA